MPIRDFLRVCRRIATETLPGLCARSVFSTGQGVSESGFDYRRGAVVGVTKQVRICAKCGGRIPVPNPAADGYDVQAGSDERAYMALTRA